MADDKQTPTTEEHPTLEVTGPAEQPAAETATPEQTHDSADNVIPFGNAGLDSPGPGAEHEEDTRQEWEKPIAEVEAEQKKPKRGHVQKAEKETPSDEKAAKPRRGRPAKVDKAALDAAKPQRDKVDLLTKYHN